MAIKSLLGPFIAICFFLDAAAIAAAWIYSRFVFGNYLRRRHAEEWRKLAYDDSYRGTNFLGFDKNESIYQFRTQSTDDLGDLRLQVMRARSKWLTRLAIWLWIGTAGAIVAACVLVALDHAAP